MINRDAIAWYAFRVKPRHEKAVSLALQGKGFEDFVPTYTSKRADSEHTRTSLLPLIPGYIFCKLDPALSLPILTIPGVSSIVSFGKRPAVIDESEMRNFQSAVRSGLNADSCSSFAAGDLVRIESGPLKGVEGRVVSSGKERRLIVSISLVQRSISVVVDECWLRREHCPRLGASANAAYLPMQN